jgi:hypothetical protein
MALDYRCPGFRQWRCLVQQAHARNAALNTEALAARTDFDPIRELAREALVAATQALNAATALDHSTAFECARRAMALEAKAVALARAS